MKTFKAILSAARDTSETEDFVSKKLVIDGVAPREVKSAEFTFRSVGPFPDLKNLYGKTVEIRILD